ncbi:unnamed protein product [Blepharisma stoltei]|uniref:EF-hand domain-containing protein n=1 Tax=Blepharisma stoltei TaxID=1481888 RepID=A0AAU9J3X2_9CILI|nr:unnamed protein product [Blepharisma stoltei]
MTSPLPFLDLSLALVAITSKFILFKNIMDSKAQMLDIVNDDIKLHCITQAIFAEHNRSDNNTIGFDQFYSIIKAMNRNTSYRPPRKGEVREIFKEIDTDNDGLISFEDFKILIRRVLMCALDI